MESLDLVIVRPGDHVPNQTPMVVGEILTTLLREVIDAFSGTGGSPPLVSGFHRRRLYWVHRPHPPGRSPVLLAPQHSQASAGHTLAIPLVTLSQQNNHHSFIKLLSFLVKCSFFSFSSLLWLLFIRLPLLLQRTGDHAPYTSAHRTLWL